MSQLDLITICQQRISQLILGGNPFSGYSHQGESLSLEMKKYYTVSRIKETLREAEKLGINTLIARTDNHIIRMLLEYWEEGGTIQWIAQTAAELETINRGEKRAVEGGAKACFIHGGQMDSLLEKNQIDMVTTAIAEIRNAGLLAGVAGHDPDVFKWIENTLDVNFYMCSYYNPSKRSKQGEYVNKDNSIYSVYDRNAMVEQIKSLSKPVIHYKVLAAGRIDPKDAFTFVARHLRSNDAVCIGVYTKINSHMIEEDVQLLMQCLGTQRENIRKRKT
jgi:hypothetical protein